ncbi:MAG: glycosyltransferase family 2 protein [Congregibacter sp.]
MDALSISYFTAASLIVYSYALYPMLLSVIAPRLGRFNSAPSALVEDQLPSVTFLIAAHNEAQEIRQRIENLLALDYPPELMQILIASDGSSDDTFAIASSFDDNRVRAEEHTPNIGKSATLNRYLPEARGDVIIMSDANTHFSSDVARLLVRWLANPGIIAVSGKLSLLDPETGNNVDSAYWRYENKIKRLEGLLGAKLGANGAIYAFRKADFAGFPSNTIVDDFVIPLLIKLRRGGNIVFDTEACATEPTPADISDEFTRRVRIGTGAYQSLSLLWPLILPRHGWTSFCFFSHKILRWLTPFLLVFMVTISFAGVGRPLFNVLLALEAIAGATVFVGLRIGGSGVLSQLLRTASMFGTMNAALFLGCWRYLTTPQSGTWKRTSRSNNDDK